jgi:hypothetical protein
MSTILLFCALAFFSTSEVIAANNYQIIHFKGSVSVFRNNKTLPVTEKKFQLELNDKVSTGESSLAIIKSQRMTFKVVENSDVSIAEKEQEVLVDVDRGGVVVNYVKEKVKDIVSPTLKVTTKHTVMGVRGTTFFAYNFKDQTSYLTVKEGKVDFRGVNSSKSDSVSGEQSAFTDKSLKNIKPQKVGFEEDINWELSDFKTNLAQPKALFSKMEEQWTAYKKENEKKWNNHKESMDDQWNKMKDQL